MNESVLHKPCGLVISEEEEKAIVDKWLRDVRSKGGKSRWKNHESIPRERPDPDAVRATRWATRRENRFRKSVVDGESPWINGVRLVLDFSGMGEVLQAEYSFHSKHASALFETSQGFQKAWEKAQVWIVERRQEVKKQSKSKEKENGL